MEQTAQTEWVLKFISGKYQGGEFPLEEGGEITIGRSSDSSMVLVEDMVSRHHAKITVENSDVILEDLGSTNGSFVNGERVSRCVLKEGDRILFGTSIMKLVHRDPNAATDDDDRPAVGMPAPRGAEIKATRQMSAQEAAGPARAPAQTGGVTLAGAMTGLIEEVPLVDLLQLFATARKTGVLTLAGPDGEGQVHLRNGRVIGAIIDGRDDLTAEKAFFRLLRWETGTFVLEPSPPGEFENEIDMSTEALIMEAMRQFDELENLGSSRPDPTDVLQIKRPLVPPLRSLTPEILDTLQLVINYGEVGTILDKSLASDLETLQDVMYLIKNNYLEITR